MNVEKPASDLRETSRKIWEDFSEKKSSMIGEKLSFIPPIIKEGKRICIIDPADVVNEPCSWNGSIIYAVLGSKPPFKVFKGFMRRIWDSFSVEKVLRLENNHFIVKIKDEKARDAIIAHGIWFFERKPLIVRA